MTKDKEPQPHPEQTQTPPPTPPQADPVTKFRIELEFDIQTSRLVIRSKAPTVILCGILKLAETQPPAMMKDEGYVRRVIIEYDATTDKVQVATDATDLVLRGIFAMVYSSLTTNQVLQHVQAIQKKARILGPAGEQVN